MMRYFSIPTKRLSAICWLILCLLLIPLVSYSAISDDKALSTAQLTKPRAHTALENNFSLDKVQAVQDTIAIQQVAGELVTEALADIMPVYIRVKPSDLLAG